MRIPRTLFLTTAAVATSAALLLPATPAHGLWRGHYEVLKSTRTCVTLWDHIDGNGRPYGKKVVVCGGKTAPTSVDWDMACWPNGYKLIYSPRGRWVPQTDNTSDNCHKFRTFSDVVMLTEKD